MLLIYILMYIIYIRALRTEINLINHNVESCRFSMSPQEVTNAAKASYENSRFQIWIRNTDGSP